MGTLPANLNKRTLALFAVVLLFLLLLLFYLYGLKPAADDASAQRSQIESLQKQSALLKQKAAEQNSDQAANTAPDVQEVLPLSDNTEQLLLDLQSISAKNDVTLLNTSFAVSASNSLQSMLGGAKTPFPTVQEVQVTVGVQGTYEHLLVWIDSLQKLDRLLNVNTFALSKPAAGADSPISTTVSFTAYYDPAYRSLVDHEITPYTS